MAKGFTETLQQVDRVFVRWRGRKLVYFGGCDYLRLSSHPKMIRALNSAAAKYGLTVAASRRTTGNHVLYEQLEAATARFFSAEQAILVSNGYLTNIVAAQGLRGSIDHVFIDDHAHFSLRDAAAFLDCPLTEFAHRDPMDLLEKVRKCSRRTSVAVLTDGMFANDGSVAPLQTYQSVVGPKALLWVDDAHAAGILGKQGRGTVEFEKVDRRNVVQTITFSKAFGAYGGAILCDSSRAGEIISKSWALMGNTPLPLPVAAAAMTALEICRKDLSRRKRLWRNVELFWEETGKSPLIYSPIVSVMTRDSGALKKRLIEAKIYPPFIEYGSGPVSQYFRFAISSEHTAEQIKRLAHTLMASRRKIEKDELLFLGLDV